MFEANRRFFVQSGARGDGTLSVSAPRRSAVPFVADRGAGERKFIWPLAATLMLIVLAWALATEFGMPPEQRAAIFAVQSQAYP
jgi:hypothetical protein